MATRKAATKRAATTTKNKKGSKVISVTYERLLNLGNYENERVAATVAVEGGKVDAAINEARTVVNKALGLDITAAQIKQAQQLLERARRRQ